MTQSNDDSFCMSSSPNRNKPFPMETDEAFHATPLVTPKPAAANRSEGVSGENLAMKADSTFMQNQIAIQRSPSGIKDHASALSRTLSVKSDGSHESPMLSLSSFLTPESKAQDPNLEVGYGRERGEFDTSMIDGPNRTLSKTDSERSSRSVRSIQAIGTHPVDTLRVHYPTPTPSPRSPQHDFFKSGDVVVVRDMPVGVHFGYDTTSFIIQQLGAFEGIKDLPPGAHFIWAGSGDGSLRTGFWIMTSKLTSSDFGEIIVKKWNKFDEVLTEEVSEAEVRIQQSTLPEFIDKLQSYKLPFGKGLQKPAVTPVDPQVWVNLTSSMKGAFLNRVTGEKKWNHWQVSSSHDYKIVDGIHGDNPRDFGKDEVLDFVFPRALRTFSSESLGRERTEQAMDTSSHVRAIIDGICTHEDSDEIIGEMQFCYTTGMILGNVVCMEHWAHVVKVMLRAYKLVMELPKFYIKFVKAFHAQLAFDGIGIEGSIFDTSESLENDLKNMLITFKSRLSEQLLGAETRLLPDQEAVGKAFDELESFLWTFQRGWDLRGNYVRSGQYQLQDGEFVDAEVVDFEAEDERGEFAPVMVQLDEDGREQDRIRF